MKTCSKCEAEKPESEFPRDRRKRSGLGSHCLACVSKKNAAYLRRMQDRAEVERPEVKRCPTCKTTKPSTEFGWDSSRLDGLLSVCKVCAKIRRQRYLYRATPEEIAAHLEAQGGLCAICRKEFGAKGYHVDHCHRGGQVRGLLCLRCNSGLGMFQDDPERLRVAIEYLAL